jgi:hypothetical protein
MCFNNNCSPLFHFLNIDKDAYVFGKAKVVEKEGRGGERLDFLFIARNNFIFGYEIYKIPITPLFAH